MRKSAGVIAFGLLLSGAAGMWAQDTAVIPPPKVLVIEREFIKPGKFGPMHEKSESAFIAAFTAAKWPTHYLAAESMSGRPRVLFMLGYPSFEAWEKDNHAMEKNTSLMAALDKAIAVDGELQTQYSEGVFTYDAEHSLRAGDAVHGRYFEITQFHVKQGHRAEFMELAKVYKDAMEKVSPMANWALYESAYGEDNGGEFLAISLTKSLAEDDQGTLDGQKMMAGMGAAGMKKIAELEAASIESQQTNLFSFSAKMSYPGDDWIKADDFWKPKAAPVAKKAVANP